METIKLNPKEEKFCYEYCMYLNATKAVINAGYSEKTARSIGSQLLTKLNIKKRIEELQSDLVKASGITKARIVDGLAKLAFSNLESFQDSWISQKEWDRISKGDKYCVKEIQTKIKKTKRGEERFVKFKLEDKQKAIETLVQILGFDAPAKVEMLGKDITIQIISDSGQVDPDYLKKS
jgi:phage terminase small subunit